MTEEEKQRHLNSVRAGLAFGGGELSPEMEVELRMVLNGKQTYGDIR